MICPLLKQIIQQTRRGTMNFTRHDYETILYSLEGYIQGNDDDKLCDELVDICYRIERKLSDMDYTPSSDYKDKVDRLVENMKTT